MFIELWMDGQREIINTAHVARVYASKGDAIEIQFTYTPWDLPEDYHRGDPMEGGINAIIFDVPYSEFKAALQSGKDFVSLCGEDEPST